MPTTSPRTQIRRDIALSASVGADVHILATVEEVPEPAAALARKVSDRSGVGVLILGRDDLRPSA